MIQQDIPYTYENSSNPWLMDKKDDTNIITINNHKLTAAYLWSLNNHERENALQDVFNYYREKGFPYITLTDDEIIKNYNKLINYNEEKIIKNNYISNSGTLCLDLCKYYCRDNFYKAKGDVKSLSVEDVFNNDELFIKVLKNRMGWNTSKEDGTERSYIFPISDKQILNGIRNSGMGYGVSNFRPTIGKWMYKHGIDLYNINKETYNIFDYSGGWGARMMGALSLNCNYTCTDPLTYNNLQHLYNDFKRLNLINNQSVNIFNFGSENPIFLNTSFKENFDIIGSCPPYFTLEIYSDDKTQCMNEYNNYNLWLSEYWHNTVANCYHMLKPNGIFILVMKEMYGKFNLLEDMKTIIYENNLTLIEDWQYKTTTNHLSGKTKTGKSTKINEHILFFKK